MADKEDLQQPESLNCPLCLDAFKNPTLLRCGHTFCNVCLGKYDERHQGQEYMECPVCKKRTKLGHYRVAGLSQNFSVKGLKDELHGKVIGSSSNFCSFHSDIYKDIFCEDCKEFICLSCFLDKHQRHKIKKKEALEADLKKKREALEQKFHSKKVQIEMSIINYKQDKCDIRTHLQNLGREIDEAFDKKAAILRENKKRLSEEAKQICNMALYKRVKLGIACQRKAADNIESHLTVLKGNANKYLDSDALKALQAKLTDLENELEKDIDNTSMARTIERVRNIRFRQADGAVLDLGCLEQQANAMECDLSQVKTVPGVRSNAYEVQGSSRVADIPTSVQSTSVTPQRGIELPGRVSGMGEGLSLDCSSVSTNSAGLQGRCDVADKPTAVQATPMTTMRKNDLPGSVSGMGEGSSQECPGVGNNAGDLQIIQESSTVKDIQTTVQKPPLSSVRQNDLPVSVSGMAIAPPQACAGVSSNAGELQSLPGSSTMVDILVQTAPHNLPVPIVRKNDLPVSVSGMATVPPQACAGVSSNAGELQSVPGSGTIADIHVQTALQNPPVPIVRKNDLPVSVSGLGTAPSRDRAGVTSNAGELQSLPGSSTMADIHVQTALHVHNPPVPIVRKIDLPDSVSGMGTTPSQDCAGASSNAGEIQNVPGSSLMADVQNPPAAIVKKINSGMANAKSQDCTGVSIGEVPGTSRVADIPTSVHNTAVTIVRKFDLPVNVSGMAAAPSRDAVMIGYGKNRHGADSFSLSDSKRTHLNTRVGPVYDISFLSDGKLVVSHGQSFGIYSLQDGSLQDTRHDFRCRQNRYFNTRLCVDQHDKVYGVNSNCKINIFNGQTITRRHIVYPLRVESLRMRAAQMCITTTGAMIVSTCNRGLAFGCVIVYGRFDKDGPLTSQIGVMADNEDEDEYLYAAIDTQDRVLVARVMIGSDLFSLTRYTLEGIRLTEPTIFKPFRLPHSIEDSSSWCYMVSLTPKLIAFATGIHLYFMQLPM